ncbi:MAG: alpha-L-fucosidase [Oscillospiraceae bacterium]|nr:alpha-L-fucosidase [Oscillospiraceae bacterium]
MLNVTHAQPTPGNTKWFQNDRFGLFIHWGTYALAARHEWVKNIEAIPDEIYDKYFKHFDPDLYDPNLWAKAASDAGMKYFVITTKHHEGFCLWDTDLTDYKATNTPYGKDVLTPMVNAFREQNMKVGFYHSLLDWHHPEYTLDECHALKNNAEYQEKAKNRDLNKYVDYLWGQTKELMTRFGKVDILWYDFSIGKSDRFPGKGRNEWRSEELIKMIRGLQPEIIINDRLEIDQDVKTPEQYQPREWVKVDGKPVVWEACQTFSGSWGYHRDEQTWKSVDMLVQMLIDTVSKGGNLLLNVGPTGRGEFDERALSALSGMGKWMQKHSRSIYGCTQAPAEFTTPKDCRLTYNPDKNRLYIHMFSYPFGGFFMDGKEICDRIEYAQFLNDASEVRYNISGETISFNIPVVKPNVTVPVIEVYLK